ncbi:hypothetical protein WN48_10867, partial [Eufriesea mexicana]
QLSTMIGIKDPTEPPKLEQLKQGHEQMNYAMKSVTIQNLDLANIQMHFFEFSKGMADKFSMPTQHCFLCASDEGVFLDITADNKQIYCDQFETCSLVKVPRADQLPTKICHKCAYELKQCSSFVQKYKRGSKQRAAFRRLCCTLCREPAKNEFIFDISKEKDLQRTSFDKIQQLFSYELGKSYEEHKLICLSCRYTIDLLLDLKNICKETATKLNDTVNEEIDYLTFPKIKTTVINRKTTITESARTNLYTSQESESDEMTRTRSQSNKVSNNKLKEKTKLQVCSKCHDSIKIGHETYKIHKTKSIVCKTCWKNMDMHSNEVKKQIPQNLTEIKLCTVSLKDVLKDTEIKEKKLYRIDEDDKGNKAYVITDKDLANGNKEMETSKVVTGDNTEKHGQKRSVKSIKSTNDEDVPNKKHKIDVKEASVNNVKESKLVTKQLRNLRQNNGTRNISQSSDSDSPVPKIGKRSERILTRHKRATGSSLSDADIDSKHNRKKLKTILRGIAIDKNADVSDESSNEDVMSKKNQLNFEKSPLLRRKRSTYQKFTKSSTVNIPEELQSESDSKEDIFKTRTYVCDECGASYENKLMGLTHKLMHYKQPKLKLQKLSDSLIKEELGSNEAVDDQSEDLSETIGITVEDDEEELMEDEKNLNTNNEIDVNSDSESRINFSKKDAVEDAVDVELVMKESDDDQIHKTVKETKDLQETEVADKSVQNENETKEQKDKQKECEDNYNDNDKTDKKIEAVDSGSSNKSKLDDDIIEENKTNTSKKIEQANNKNKETKKKIGEKSDNMNDIQELNKKSPKCMQKTKVFDDNEIQTKTSDIDSKESKVLEETVLQEENSTNDKIGTDISSVELSELDISKDKESASDSANAAAEVLQEILDLASAKVQKQQEIIDINIENDSIESETLENISREIQNSVDMPPLKMDDAKSENGIHVE